MKSSTLDVSPPETTNRRPPPRRSLMTGTPVPTLRRIQLFDLFIDRAYQRDISLSHIRAIVRNFDPLLLGQLTVNKTRDGHYNVIDGQHRLEALRIIGGIDDVLCIVYDGLSRSDEAKLFVGPQANRRGIYPMGRFKAALVAQTPEALQIKELVDRYHFQIHWGSDSYDDDKEHQLGRIAAISTLENIHRRAIPNHLATVLSIIADGWNERGSYVVPARLLLGVDMVVRRHHNRYDRDVLIDAIAATPLATFDELFRSTPGGHHDTVGEAVICEIYNEQVRTKELSLPKLEPLQRYRYKEYSGA